MFWFLIKTVIKKKIKKKRFIKVILEGILSLLLTLSKPLLIHIEIKNGGFEILDAPPSDLLYTLV